MTDDQTPKRIDPLDGGKLYLAPIDTAMPVSTEDLQGFTPFGFASDPVEFVSEGLTELPPFDFQGGTFTTEVTFEPGAWDALAAAIPVVDEHDRHGHLEGPWTCPVCDAKIMMRARIDVWTEEPFWISATVENDEELRAHARTHGLDGADEVPLVITVGAKR